MKRRIPTTIDAKQYGRLFINVLMFEQEQLQEGNEQFEQQFKLQDEQHSPILENKGQVHLYCFFGVWF